MSAFNKLVMALLLNMISAMAFAVTDAQVFAYAEANYPNLFSGAATAGAYQTYNYRYYPASQNYLAVDTAGMIYMMGASTGGALTFVGAVSSFAGLIAVWEAQGSPPVVVPARGKRMRVSGESLVLASTIPGNLSFDKLTSGSVVVRSTYQANDPDGIAYQEGVDYTVDYPNGTIARTMSSRIPDFSTNVLYGQHDFDQNNFPGYTNHPFFVWVDYETSNGEDFAKPNDQARYLITARTKLETGGTFRIVSYGDSITAGKEASTPDLRFTALYRNYLQSRFPGSTIVVEDVSRPGYTSTQALAAWNTTVGVTSPDLVLLGWGMNDHNLDGNTPEQFKQNLITLVGMVRNLTHADVILFSAFPPNEEWHYGTHRMNLYAEATRQAAAESNCAYVNVLDTWAMVLQRKDLPSLLGNNINHPNNFGHWMYQQAFAAMSF